MGLFDFAKDVGRRLGLGKGKTEDQDAIKKEVKDLGLNDSGVEIEVAGDTVILTGKPVSQEEKEKIILAAGNVEGVAKVEDKTESASAGPEPVFHEVARGDTLWAIAKKHYGSGAKYTAIFEANKPMLSDPDKIYPGQRLRIPPQD